MEQQIVQWVMYDNKIKEYADKSKRLRNERDSLQNDILNRLTIPSTTKNKDMPQFNIDALNTKLSCYQSTSYEAINFKFLKRCFTEYFLEKTKTTEDNESLALERSDALSEELLNFIKERRSSEQKLTLKDLTYKDCGNMSIPTSLSIYPV